MHLLSNQRQRGFSLVELMVGMTIGLIVVLIITLTLSVSEGYRRTTTFGSDAQINGLVALRALEAEVRMAGYGTQNSANLCPTINSLAPSTSTVTSSTGMPIKLVDGGTSALLYSDTIEMVYSGSDFGGAGLRITEAMPTPSNVTKVNTVNGLKTCDFVLYASKDGSKACTMLQVTGFNGNNPQFLTGSGQSNYNPPGGFNGALFPPGGYNTNDVIINMGSFVDKRFSVNKTASKDEYFLRVTNLMSANSGCGIQDPNPQLDIVSNIVNIQAQYGVAPAASQQVNCWTSAATTDVGCGITAGQNWSNPPPVDVVRIKAVRVAVVARSALSERPSTVGGNCDTTTVAPTSWDGGPAINLTADPNWQCYRYKVYQTVIPMINVIWANS